MEASPTWFAATSLFFTLFRDAPYDFVWNIVDVPLITPPLREHIELSHS